MKILPPLVMLALTAVMGAAIACSSDPAPPSAQPEGEATSSAQPAGEATVLGDLRKDWQAQKDTMMKIADAMPEEKFAYRSTPPQRSYGEQIMHVVEANVDLLKAIGGKAAPPPASAPKSKAEILKALADSYDYGAALLEEQTDATIRQTVVASYLGPSTRARVFWSLLGHSMDIYGQMAVYLRLNGIVPPASRGI